MSLSYKFALRKEDIRRQISAVSAVTLCEEYKDVKKRRGFHS